jgi:hypothetical protein
MVAACMGASEVGGSNAPEGPQKQHMYALMCVLKPSCNSGFIMYLRTAHVNVQGRRSCDAATAAPHSLAIMLLFLKPSAAIASTAA